MAITLGDESGSYCSGLEVSGQAGAVDATTRFPLGCLAKPLISLLCLEASGLGLLDLERSPSDYLSELAGDRAQRAEPTLGQLLTHTGGYREPRAAAARWDFAWADFARFYRSREQVFVPGTVWSYSQSGHAILARILEALHGAPFRTLLGERLLGPLGLDPVPGGAPRNAALHSYAPAAARFMPFRIARGGGFLADSIADLWLTPSAVARLGALLWQPEPLPGALQAGLASIQQPAFRPPPEFVLSEGETLPHAVTPGLALYGPAIGLNGSFVGATSSLRVLPQARFAVVVALNAWQANVRDAITDSLVAGAAEAWGIAPAGAAARAEPAAPSLAELAGTYSALMLGMSGALVHPDGRVVVELGGKPVEGCLIETGQGLRLTGPHSLSTRVLPGHGEPVLRFGLSAFARIDSRPDQAFLKAELGNGPLQRR